MAAPWVDQGGVSGLTIGEVYVSWECTTAKELYYRMALEEIKKYQKEGLSEKEINKHLNELSKSMGISYTISLRKRMKKRCKYATD